MQQISYGTDATGSQASSHSKYDNQDARRAETVEDGQDYRKRGHGNDPCHRQREGRIRFVLVDIVRCHAGQRRGRIVCICSIHRCCFPIVANEHAPLALARTTSTRLGTDVRNLETAEETANLSFLKGIFGQTSQEEQSAKMSAAAPASASTNAAAEDSVDYENDLDMNDEDRVRLRPSSPADFQQSKS